jgi:putative ABC transport system substrate-binding protein
MDRGWSEVQILRYLLLAIALSICAYPATAAELLIVQSHQSRPLDQTTRLIMDSCAPGATTLLMSDYAEFDLGRIVREQQPSALIAIGDNALKAALKIRKTPVIYSMALNADESTHGNNITGISMAVSPDNFMKLFKELKLGRVGVIYNPAISRAYIRRAKEAAKRHGVELVNFKINSSKEVDTQLARLTP